METRPLDEPPPGIRAERHSSALRVVLDKPGRRNAIDAPMLTFLGAALDVAVADPEVHCLTLSGVGDFCAGADIAWLAEHVKGPEDWAAWLDLLSGTVQRLDQCPLPLIAAVPGYAVGGGLELVLAADVVVASEEARLGDGHVRNNFVPGGGSSFRLERRVSPASARYLLLTGRLLPAAEARTRGLVDEVVPADDLDGTVRGYEEGFGRAQRPLLIRLKRLQGRREQAWSGTGWALERLVVEAALAEGSAGAAIDQFSGRSGTTNA